MDVTTRELERKVAADPTDGAAAAQLARAFARDGRLDDARETVRERFARGEIDADTVSLAVELAAPAIEGRLAASPRANFSYVIGSAARQGHAHEGLVELAPPVIAFAGLPGAGAQESVLALRDVLGSHIVEQNSSRVDDERVLELEVELRRPWVLARAHSIRAIRIVTIPVAPHAVKLRRQLLATTSALAFVVDARSEIKEDGADHFSNEAAWKALQNDFRRARGYALEELPIVFQYHDAVEEAWHRWLTVAMGLRPVPRVTTGLTTSAPDPEAGAPRFSRSGEDDRVTAHDGVIETLAFLLAGVGAAVRGIATPRPRFRSRKG